MERHRIGWALSLILTICLATYIVLALALPSEPTYQTGSLTKGNPDNSYLDTGRVYCCGD